MKKRKAKQSIPCRAGPGHHLYGTFRVPPFLAEQVPERPTSSTLSIGVRFCDLEPTDVSTTPPWWSGAMQSLFLRINGMINVGGRNRRSRETIKNAQTVCCTSSNAINRQAAG